jgi:hypothetical protein
VGFNAIEANSGCCCIARWGFSNATVIPHLFQYYICNIASYSELLPDRCRLHAELMQLMVNKPLFEGLLSEEDGTSARNIRVSKNGYKPVRLGRYN